MNERKSKIMSAAASFGWRDGIYPNEVRELEAEGRIVCRVTFTRAGGNRVLRWFLA